MRLSAQRIAAAAALAIGCFLAYVPAPAWASSFCKSPKVVWNYWRPLEEAPRPHLLSSSGRLGFGPSALRIDPPRSELVVPGLHGFYLSGSRAGAGAARKAQARASLGWFVSSRLEQIDTEGRLIRVVKSKTQYIEHIGGFERRTYGFRGQARPGIYRLALEFENKKHQRLGVREVLFRAVEDKSRLRLGISSTTLRQGATGYLRVENLGTVRADYYYRYRLWSIHDGALVETPIEPLVLTNDQPRATAGMAADCFTFKVPDDLAAGDYVVGVPVESFLHSQSRYLLKQFSVMS